MIITILVMMIREVVRAHLYNQGVLPIFSVENKNMANHVGAQIRSCVAFGDRAFASFSIGAHKHDAGAYLAHEDSQAVL